MRLIKNNQSNAGSAPLSKHATLVRTALLKEIYLTPKPGLVDQLNNGAHNDMTLQTFIQSIDAIEHWFDPFYLLGRQYPTLQGQLFLKKLRSLGLACEEAMFKATQGINTHKGGIFAFALLCAAIGRLEVKQITLNSQTICHEVATICQHIKDELTHCTPPTTAGEKIYQQYGFTGARGEAASGYLMVREVALPIYKQLQAQSFNEQSILLHTLLHLIANNNDTNLIARGGIRGLELTQHTAEKLLASHSLHSPLYRQSMLDFDQLLIKNHLSPGGSADLLAVTWFLAQYDLR